MTTDLTRGELERLRADHKLGVPIRTGWSVRVVPKFIMRVPFETYEPDLMETRTLTDDEIFLITMP